MPRFRPLEDNSLTCTTTVSLPSREQLATRILQKMEIRRKLGWVDYSFDSYDRRVANARASRVVMRRSGKRATLRHLMWG